MLTAEEDINAHALHQRGWKITAIANHLGVTASPSAPTRSGDRTLGRQARSGPDPFEAFVAYCTARLTEDPHRWATTLMDELAEVGSPAPTQP